MSQNSNVREPIIEMHDGVRTIRCPYPNCKVVVKKLWNYHSHARTHTDERPYRCGVCQMKYRWQSSLKSHEKSHERKNRGRRGAPSSATHSEPLPSLLLPSVDSLLRPESDPHSGIPRSSGSSAAGSSARAFGGGAARSTAPMNRLLPPPTPIHPPTCPPLRSHPAPVLPSYTRHPLSSGQGAHSRRQPHTSQAPASGRRSGPHTSQTTAPGRRAQPREDRSHRPRF